MSKPHELFLPQERYRHSGSVKQGIKEVSEVSIYLCEVCGFFAEGSDSSYQVSRWRGAKPKRYRELWMPC